MLRKVPMKSHELCFGAHVELDEFNVLTMTVNIGNPLNWYTKTFSFHPVKIIEIDTEVIETSDDDGMPMYFDTTDSDGTRIRWSTRKGRFGKPVYIWPKGSTFSI